MATNNYTYSDFDINFNVHPVRQDLNKLTDERSIVQAVRNLVLMNKWESPFDPMLGSNLRALLFENNDPMTEMMIAEFIKEVITNHEPRVTLRQIDLEFDEAGDGYTVTIDFLINTINRAVSTTIYLDRAG